MSGKVGRVLVAVCAVVALVVALWAAVQLSAIGVTPFGAGVEPVASAPIGQPGSTRFNDLEIEKLTVNDETHLNGALWGTTAITLVSPSAIRLQALEVALGDTAETGPTTQFTLSDGDKMVTIGSPDTGAYLIVDVGNQLVRNAYMPLYTRRAVTSTLTSVALAVDDTWGVYTNRGAQGAITMTLPAASSGVNYCFYVAAAQALNVDTATGDQIASLTNAAGDKIANSTPGSSLCLVAEDETNWLPLDTVGTWTDAN